MNLLSIPFPDIDPVAIHLGPLAIKWYGLAYMAGLLLGWLYIKHLLRQDRLWPGAKSPFGPDKADDLLLYMTLGVLLGGRLGYVLFYEPRFFLGAEEALMALDLAVLGWAMVYAHDVVTHHHPSPARDVGARRLGGLRNRLWLAWLRLPVASG